MIRTLAATLTAAALAGAAFWLHGARGYGRDYSFMLLMGAGLGVCLQRSQLCFNSALRDLFQRRERRASTGFLAALAAGSIGYTIVYLAQLPDPARYLPDTAHVGPASWVGFLGGFLFGFGLILGGGCISGHLFRLGEGSLTPLAGLLAVVPGCWLGLLLWNPLYLSTLSTAPVVWLPRTFGYAGSLTLQLLALAGLAVLLLRKTRAAPPPPPEPDGLPGALRTLLVRRWPAWVGGTAIGLLGTFAFMIVEPLGVTSPFGRWARLSGSALGMVPERLEGLDRMAGCRAIVSGNPLTPPLVLVLALVAGSFLAALLSGEFRPRLGTWKGRLRAIAGGFLIGLGASVSLGCTIGTLLSGIMAHSLHGWIFGAGLLLGAWAALRGPAAPCTSP